MRLPRVFVVFTGLAVASLALSGCATGGGHELPPASYVATQEHAGEEYVIGPLDQLNIFVWRNPELSAKVQVRPDGRITTPLINDMPAVGKTPAMLADDMKLALSEYIKDPIVSVIVENFSGTFSQQIRVVGATDDGFKPLKVNASSLAVDDSGLRIQPKHIHRALRRSAGLADSVGDKQFPIAGEDLPLFG